MNWYLAVLQKYVVFSGRARRKEYWMFVLFNSIFALILYFMPILKISGDISVLYSLYCLGVFLPSLAVAIRRLHDIGKAGTWFLVIFIPIIGGIWLLILLAKEGIAGDNQYGPDPKANDLDPKTE